MLKQFSRFEKSEFEITVDGIEHMIKLYDTAGQEEYDQLRKTIYKHVRITMNFLYLRNILKSQRKLQADCFLVCYSVDNRDSYNNVQPYWVKELKSVANHVPIVLCGEFLISIQTKLIGRNCLSNKYST